MVVQIALLLQAHHRGCASCVHDLASWLLTSAYISCSEICSDPTENFAVLKACFALQVARCFCLVILCSLAAFNCATRMAHSSRFPTWTWRFLFPCSQGPVAYGLSRKTVCETPSGPSVHVIFLQEREIGRSSRSRSLQFLVMCSERFCIPLPHFFPLVSSQKHISSKLHSCNGLIC